jgi:hypothetical protein
MAEREGWLLKQHAVSLLEASFCVSLLGVRTKKVLTLPRIENNPFENGLFSMAEREGFEPSKALTLYRISSAAH